MTADEVITLLQRVWPIAVVIAPTTWGAAKLYYDREIPILQQRLEVEKAESERLRALKEAHPPEESAFRQQLRAARLDVATGEVVSRQRDD